MARPDDSPVPDQPVIHRPLLPQRFRHFALLVQHLSASQSTKGLDCKTNKPAARENIIFYRRVLIDARYLLSYSSIAKFSGSYVS